MNSTIYELSNFRPMLEREANYIPYALVTLDQC